jgi:hypothetical protein
VDRDTLYGSNDEEGSGLLLEHVARSGVEDAVSNKAATAARDEGVVGADQGRDALDGERDGKAGTHALQLDRDGGDLHHGGGRRG